MGKRKISISDMFCQHCIKKMTDALTVGGYVLRAVMNWHYSKQCDHLDTSRIPTSTFTAARIKKSFEAVKEILSLSLRSVGLILIIILGITGCSDMPYTGSMLQPGDIDKYLFSPGDGRICLTNGFEAVCLTLVPKRRDGTIPIIHIYPSSIKYIFYYKGVPILQAERPMDTSGIVEQIRDAGKDNQPRDGGISSVDILPPLPLPPEDSPPVDPIPPDTGGGGQQLPGYTGGGNQQTPGGQQPGENGGGNKQTPGEQTPDDNGGRNQQPPGNTGDGSNQQTPGGQQPGENGGGNKQTPGGQTPDDNGGRNQQPPGNTGDGSNQQTPGGQQPGENGGGNKQTPGNTGSEGNQQPPGNTGDGGNQQTPGGQTPGDNDGGNNNGGNNNGDRNNGGNNGGVTPLNNPNPSGHNPPDNVESHYVYGHENEDPTRNGWIIWIYYPHNYVAGGHPRNSISHPDGCGFTLSITGGTRTNFTQTSGPCTDNDSDNRDDYKGVPCTGGSNGVEGSDYSAQFFVRENNPKDEGLSATEIANKKITITITWTAGMYAPQTQTFNIMRKVSMREYDAELPPDPGHTKQDGWN